MVLQTNIRIDVVIRKPNAQSLYFLQILDVVVLRNSANVTSVNVFLPRVCEQIHVDNS